MPLGLPVPLCPARCINAWTNQREGHVRQIPCHRWDMGRLCKSKTVIRYPDIADLFCVGISAQDDPSRSPPQEPEILGLMHSM